MNSSTPLQALGFDLRKLKLPLAYLGQTGADMPLLLVLELELGGCRTCLGMDKRQLASPAITGA